MAPTLIELFTYRAGGAFDERRPEQISPGRRGRHWPLGDPDRAAEAASDRGSANGRQSATRNWKAKPTRRCAPPKEAEAIGVLGDGERPEPGTMFDDVYKDMPWHLRRQRQELGSDHAGDEDGRRRSIRRWT